MNDRPEAIPGWNLGLRFVLELAALAGFAYGGWHLFPGPFAGLVAAIVAFGLAATVWGVFNVPGDPSRNGKAPVAVPGWVRLALELVVFVGGAACWALAGAPVVAAVLIALLLVHLAFSGGRLRWMRQRH
jgi:hypothetical protein